MKERLKEALHRAIRKGRGGGGGDLLGFVVVMNRSEKWRNIARVSEKHGVSSPHAIKIKHSTRCFHYSAGELSGQCQAPPGFFFTTPRTVRATKQTGITSKRNSHYSETEMYPTGSKIRGEASPERYSSERGLKNKNGDQDQNPNLSHY